MVHTYQHFGGNCSQSIYDVRRHIPILLLNSSTKVYRNPVTGCSNETFG